MNKRTAPTLNGIFNIDKPEGMTSHDVVARVRRVIGQRRVGHAGTLDPMASGVLPVVVGTATRLVEYLAEADKAYRATLVLGITSDTYDREGTLTTTENAANMPSSQELDEALEAFRGEIEQVPPMHSAIKIGGKKLYELARQGIEVERQARRVTITRLEVEMYRPPLLQIFVECSKGTYIRSLVHDLGAALGTGAYLNALVRTRHGPFTLEEATTLEGIEAAIEEGTLQESLHPPDYILAGWKTYITTAEEERDIVQGKPLRLAAPQDGGRPMLAARTAGGELLAVLYWDEEKGFWQPKKVFISVDSTAPAKEKQQSSVEVNPGVGGTDKQKDWRDAEQFINALQDVKTLLRKYVPASIEVLASRLLQDQDDTRVIQPLITLAQEKSIDHVWRTEAMDVLGKARVTQAVEPLIHILNDEDDDLKDVRYQAALALGSIGDIRAIRPLLSLLTHQRDEIRSAAIATLGELRSTEAVEPLISFLTDLGEKKWIRNNAASALGKIGDRRAIDALTVPALDRGTDAKLRRVAAEALGELGNGNAFTTLLIVLQNKDEDNELRYTVLEALHNIDPVRSVPVFITLAKDKSETSEIRCYGIRSLGELRVQEAFKLLIRTLAQDKDAEVRAASAHALGEIGGAQVIEPLINALDDTAPAVRSSTATALGKTRDVSAFEPLVNVLRDAGSYPKGIHPGYWAAEALGEIGDKRAIEPLRDALLHYKEARGAAAVALGKLGDRWAFDRLVELMKGDHGDDCVCAHAADGLGWLDDPRAVEPLIEELADYEWSHLRYSAAEALGRIGDPRALSALREAYKHDSDYVREAIRGAIKAIEERQQKG